MASPIDQIFCPKCGRPDAVAEECSACRIVIRRFLERLAREGCTGRRVICVRCGELRGDGRRCMHCGSPLLAPYNQAAEEAGLPQAEVVLAEWPEEARRSEPELRAGRKLGGAALVVLLIVGVTAVLYLAAIRNSAALLEAESFIINHPEVLRLVGPELHQDIFPRGMIRSTPSDDRAWFVLDLKGAEGRGVARLELNRPGGLWQVSAASMSVRGTEGGIDLLPPPELAAGPERSRITPDQVIEQLREALRRAPADFELSRQLDHALTRQGRYEEVILMWNTYLLHREDDPQGWLARGKARLRRGRQPEGRQDLRRACELGLDVACDRLER